MNGFINKSIPTIKRIIPKIKTEDIKDTKESIAKEEVQKDSLQEEKKPE